jgi:RNA polymerase sigma-70 factor (ECF subfamily)
LKRKSGKRQLTELKVIAGGRSSEARFEALLRPHYELLHRTAFRLTRSLHDAEDLTQEVCVRAYPRLHELERLDDPRAWLLCVMRRLFIDHTRRYERRFVASMETTADAVIVSEAPGPAEEAELASEIEHLDRAWVHLDRDQRVLLALHDVEGYSLAEINKITGIKEGTLKSKLHRARAKLGRLLQRQNTVTRFRSNAGGRQ